MEENSSNMGDASSVVSPNGTYFEFRIDHPQDSRFPVMRVSEILLCGQHVHEVQHCVVPFSANVATALQDFLFRTIDKAPTRTPTRQIPACAGRAIPVEAWPNWPFLRRAIQRTPEDFRWWVGTALVEIGERVLD
jgi:hypothetical protein